MRALGALNMSVGTSLAFEGQGAQSIRHADTVLFNLRTLVRNAQQAYESTDKEGSDINQLVKDVENDILLLGKWLEEARSGKPIQMVVYYPSYAGLKSKYPKAELWEPSTEKQKLFVKIAKDVADKVYDKYKKLIVRTDVGMPDFTGNGIVLTHHVVDLAESRSIARLQLLESHTGALKPFTQWHTKLNNGNDLFYMPFNRLTIQIFGDKSTNFKPSSHSIKELVKKIAAEHKWTSATSMSRVRSSINSLSNQVDRKGLLMML